MIGPDGLNFGQAIQLMKEERQVFRANWNGKNMWIALQRPNEKSKMTLPYIYMKTVQSDLVPWLASQADILAEDWQVIE
jgi:hypothetical protein